MCLKILWLLLLLFGLCCFLSQGNMKEIKNQLQLFKGKITLSSLQTTRASCLHVLCVIGFKLQCPFSFSKTDFVVRPSTDDERAAFRDQVKSCFFLSLFKCVSFSHCIIELPSNISRSPPPPNFGENSAYRHHKLIMAD